jgi:ABC-type polysaccharide transport system, permease component
MAESGVGKTTNFRKAGPQWNRILRKMLKQRYSYIMLMPALICTVLFCYFPITGWIMAFTDYKVGKSMWKASWTGLKQFKAFFFDSGDALLIVRNTVVMNVLSIIIGLGAAFFFSILLNEVKWRRFGKLVQSITFFPYFMSWVILYAVIYSMFSMGSGAVNETFMSLGLIKEPLNILGDASYSWVLIVAVNTWCSLGYNSVIFIATIAGIPRELYEASDIDGAGRFSKIAYITIPNMVPTLIVLLIMNSGWIFNSGLDQYFVFTNPTNIQTMEVFEYYIYRYGMKLFNYSYATAVGIVRTIISFLLLILVNKLSRRYSGKSLF